MSFAKDHIDSEFEVSLIVKANAWGQKAQLKMADTNNLELHDTTNLEWDKFREMYGEYLVIGFDYGGEIMFQSTHTVRSSEDKLAVAAGIKYVIIDLVMLLVIPSQCGVCSISI